MFAWASLPTGSRTTPPASGVFGDGAIWTGTADGGTDGFKIAWNITFDSGTNLWTYSYTISDEGGGTFSQGAPSHFILELSTTITSATTGPCDNTNEICFTSLTGITNPTTYGVSGSNPGIPGNIYGIKFDSLTCNPCTFTFQTLQPPVWGDFYAKDGSAGGEGENFAYNTNFGVAPTVNDSPFTGWIPRPDGDSVSLTTTTTTTTTTSTTTTTTLPSTTTTTLLGATTTTTLPSTTTTTTLPSTTTTTDPPTTTTTLLGATTTTTLPSTTTTTLLGATTTTLFQQTTTTNPPSIPTANNWGMLALGLAFMGAMAWMLRVRRSIQ